MAPIFSQVVYDIIGVISGKNVVIYNVGFDTQILFNELYRWHHSQFKNRIKWGITDVLETVIKRSNQVLARAEYNCAMLAYSDYIGDWNDYHGNNRWQKLPGGDHSALGDCRATLAVLKQIAAAAEYQTRV